MQCIFKVTGFIVRFRKVKGGLLILAGEKPLNHLSEPQFHQLAIWGLKAQAIEAKLKPGRVFSFQGSITQSWKNGKCYQNYTIEQWMVVSKPVRAKPKSNEANEDWFVPGIEDRDTHSRRLAEGFSGRIV